MFVSHTWLQMPQLLQLRGVAMQLPRDQKQLALAAHSIGALEKSTWTSDGFHEFCWIFGATDYVRLLPEKCFFFCCGIYGILVSGNKFAGHHCYLG